MMLTVVKRCTIIGCENIPNILKKLELNTQLNGTKPLIKLLLNSNPQIVPIMKNGSNSQATPTSRKSRTYWIKPRKVKSLDADFVDYANNPFEGGYIGGFNYVEGQEAYQKIAGAFDDAGESGPTQPWGRHFDDVQAKQ